MKIAYIAHTRYPTEKAHGVQMTKVCEALVALGHDVTLLAPGVHNEIKTPYKKYYDVQQNFTAKHLPTKDALLSPLIPGRFAMAFTMKSYRSALGTYFNEHDFDLLYVRSPHVLEAALASRIPTVLELHTLPRVRKQKFISQCKQCRLVVCLTTPMKDALVAWGMPEDRVMVEGDAVDLERFTHVQPDVFTLKTEKPVVGYIGSLTTMDRIEKGVDLLIRAAAKEKNFFTFIVGGPEAAADRYRSLAKSLGLTEKDIRIEGPVSASKVPAAIAACDVCVYPAPKSNHPFFMRDTSPLKLFEYLASGKQIVCADILPVWDIVDEQTAHMVEPGSADALAQGIQQALAHPLDTKKAQKLVKKHTWEKRMERIIKSLNFK